MRVVHRTAFYFIVRNSLDNERYVTPIRERNTVGYARKNVTCSRTSILIASIRSIIIEVYVFRGNPFQARSLEQSYHPKQPFKQEK